MRAARIWDWGRTRRYDEPSNDPGLSSPYQCFPDCIIATRGYDFRKGQPSFIKWHAAGKLRIEAERNLRERSSNEKKKDSGGLSAVAGVLVVLPTTAKA